MRTNDKLPAGEVYEALQLMSALGSLSPGSTNVAGIIASQLCLVLRTRVCLIGEVPVSVAGVKMPWRPRAEFGWRDDRQRHAIFSSLDNPSAHDPTVIALLNQATPPIATFSRRELVDDDGWYNSRYFTSYRRESGLDDQAYSLWTDLRRPGWMGIIGLHRAASDPPFDGETLTLFELLHRQLVRWLWQIEPGDMQIRPLNNGTNSSIAIAVTGNNHVSSPSPPPGSGLTPAQMRVLPYLLQGYKEDKIAELLCRSRHTVHDHVMAIYREYGVHNRVELMLRFSGDPAAGSMARPSPPPAPSVGLA